MRSLIRRLEEATRVNMADQERANYAYIWNVFDKHIGDHAAHTYTWAYKWGENVRAGRTWIWADKYAKTPSLQHMKVLETRMMKREVQGYRKPQPSKQVLLDFGPPAQPPKLEKQFSTSFWLPPALRSDTEWKGINGAFHDAHLENGAQEEMERVYARVGMKDSQVVALGSRGDFKIYGAWVRFPHPRSEKEREWPAFFVICAVFTGDVLAERWKAFEETLSSFRFDYHTERGSNLVWWTGTSRGMQIQSMYQEMRQVDAKRADALWKKYGGDKPEYRM